MQYAAMTTGIFSIKSSLSETPPFPLQSVKGTFYYNAASTQPILEAFLTAVQMPCVWFNEPGP